MHVLLHVYSILCMQFWDKKKHTMKLPLLLLLLILQLIVTSSDEIFPVNGLSVGEFKPVERIEYGFMEVSTGMMSVKNTDAKKRRRLAPFQLCLLCKCCVAPGATTCATMPCCFGIDCQLPNKPYGVCAFVPKTCNCTSCAA